MDLLPNEIILMIFKFLQNDDISRMASVSRRLYKLCGDAALWSTVVMPNRWSHSNANLKKLIRNKMGQFTQSLTVIHQGPQVTKPNQPNAKQPLPRLHLSITNDLVRLLAAKCPHLTELSLAYCDLGRSFPWQLPETLTEITLVVCQLPVVLPPRVTSRGAAPAPAAGPCLPQLRRLSVYWAVSATPALLRILAGAGGLRCLELVNCPRLDAADLRLVCEQFPRLESLALPGICLAEDTALSDMVRALPDLRLLNLSRLLTHRSQAQLDDLFRGLLQARTRLRALACPAELSRDVLDKMARVPSLRLVCRPGTAWEEVRGTDGPRFASLETYYRLHCGHFYRCGLAGFLAHRPLE